MTDLLLRQRLASSETSAEDAPVGGRGDFFAIDYRAWQRACDLGLNAAITYLKLARGTLRDNRTTMWSINATEGRTGISRPKVKIALEKLIANGLVQNLNNSPTRPKRLLVPAHQLPALAQPPTKLTKQVTELMESLPLEVSEMTMARRQLLSQPIMDGTIRFDGMRYIQVDILSEKPDWIWLPNSLIDGAADETPPIENIRKGQDLDTLRLIIDLYHVHSLTFSAGVPSNLLWLGYGTDEVAHQREYRIWHFWEEEKGVSFDAPFFQPFRRSSNGNLNEATSRFAEALEVLESLGYIHFVGHVFEGPKLDAEIIHPMNWRRGTTAEHQLFDAAHSAAVALLPQCLRLKHSDDEIVPVYAHIRQVTIKGVARLHYRPRTMVTSQWLALSRKWERWSAHYADLVAKLPPTEPF